VRIELTSSGATAPYDWAGRLYQVDPQHPGSWQQYHDCKYWFVSNGATVTAVVISEDGTRSVAASAVFRCP
jgi:hypothetical protein